MPEELAEFMQDLQKSNRTPQIKLLVEWQLLNILRPFEAVAVQWSDIDWETKTLNIPADRMKGGKKSAFCTANKTSYRNPRGNEEI